MDLAISENIAVLSEKFKLSFYSSKENIYPENIHDLRVSVKRIRALIRMIQEINPESSLHKSSIKHLRKVFKSAASLRDLHIFSVIISEYFPLLKKQDEFIKFFKKQERQAKRKYRKTEKLGNKAVLELNNIQSVFIEETYKLRPLYNNDKFDILIKSRIKFIKEMLTEDLNDHYFHKLRIKLKELNHIMVLRNDTSKKALLEYFLFAARLLGVWHDHIIFLEFYRNFLNSKRKIKHNRNLCNIYETDFEYCRVEKERIISEIRPFFKNIHFFASAEEKV